MSAPAEPAERERLERWLRERVGRMLEVDPATMDADATFDSLGVASSDAIVLSGELEELLGREVAPTLLYEQPTIRAAARFLAGDGAPALAPAPARRRAAGEGPVAIVGMSCRFPGGAEGPDEFWQLLLEGRDGARTVPADRWRADDYLDPDPAAPGKAYTQTGGFLEGLAGFDAHLFGLSPAEALRMDPQQRLLLELAWAALEDAGLAPDRLRGTRTGVYVGLMDTMQYAQLQLEASGPELLNDPFFAMGAAASVAAGRISYLLDLRGPAIPVDTACSSSLVSAHLASRSLQRGECDLALVGGAGAIVHPHAMVQACKMGMLARDGRCKTFDARADGFLLGEGAGVAVLERLEDAQAARHPVLAVLEGSAINQDGRSNGLPAPSRAAQAAVIRDALADAGTEPGDLDYVEAHGSGTQLGDAIEVGALRDVFGDRPADLPPLKVGTVKTNLGHLQGAAGVAGLLKAVLMVSRGAIPRTLHLKDVNPAIDLDGNPLTAAVEHADWPRSMRPRRASVSSFGWSGTNAHVIVRAAPQRAPGSASDDSAHVLPLSAATLGALGQAAARLRDRLMAAPELPLRDVAYTLAVGRSALAARTALVCRDRADAIRKLASVASPAAADGEVSVPAGDPPRIAMTFAEAGDLDGVAVRELHEREPAFRDALDSTLADRIGRDDATPLDFVLGGSDPALGRFVVEYALAALWQRWGLRPRAVAGQAAGGCVAAAVSGALTLDEALLEVAGGRSPAAMPARLAEPADVVVEIDPSTAGRDSLLGRLGELWEAGAAIDWDGVFEGRGARRVRLPTYPFEHTRFWPQRAPAATAPADAHAGAESKRPDLADWCSTPSWTPATAPLARELPTGPWLVLADGGAAAAAARTLRDAGRVVTVVSPGDALEVNPGGACMLDPSVAEHYAELLARLGAADTAPAQVIHGWTARRPRGDGRDAVLADVEAGFGSLLLLAQALAGATSGAPVELIAASAGGMAVGHEPHEPARAMLATLCQCIGAEQENLRCRYVDLPATDADAGCAELLAELALEPGPGAVARRTGARLVRSFEPIRLEPPTSTPWRDRGVYLITGGTGGLGLVLARHLAQTARARLVLLGRTALPERGDWERAIAGAPDGDDLPRRLRALLELEEAGAEVLTVVADVAEPTSVEAAVGAARNRFGALHGVIHAAGVPGGGLIHGKTRESVAEVLRPKVTGTLALADAVRGDDLDLMVLFSSATAALGGFGESDYASANAFMDSWAASGARPASTRVVSVAWGAWRRDSWQERIFADAPALAKRVREYRDRHGIDDHEGVDLLERALASTETNVLVLPQDAETTLRSIAAVSSAEGLLADTAPRQLFPRPELRVPYAPPRTGTEMALATIWSEQLGVDRVGLDDPFFELGGSSLIGLSILARIERELGRHLLAGSLFEHPTLRALGALIDGVGEQDASDALGEQGERGQRRRELAAEAKRRRVERA
jgi:polyketide synthase 12